MSPGLIFPKETLYAYPLEVSGEGLAPSISVASHLSSLDGANSQWLKKPLAIYIHIPFCPSLCQFCGFIKQKVGPYEQINEYVNLLTSEIEFVASHIPRELRTVSCIYFGGGTPSVLSIGQIKIILDAINSNFDTNLAVEISFEGEANSLRRPKYLSEIASLGFNRLSYGIQTMDPNMRSILNLKPTLETLSTVYALASPLFEEVMVDFIFGWPGQTLDALRNDLEELMQRIRPNAIEAFLFEALDASPSFLAALSAYGVEPIEPSEAIKMRSFVKKFLNKEFSMMGYTKFRRDFSIENNLVNRPGNYDECYYGWNNGQVLGFGRGAQSFFSGAMWGSSTTPKQYSDLTSKKIIPATTFTTYSLDERERVTWPRKGYVSEKVISNDIECFEKIENLVSLGLCARTTDGYSLTETGEELVPAILTMLIPENRKETIDKITRQRLSARSTIDDHFRR
ncbi:coproporphyrinogen III oxidase-like Fe-S oxidoreductase [Pseudomonas sp. TE36184]